VFDRLHYCPSQLPPQIVFHLMSIAEFWVNSPDRPEPLPEICDKWDRLLEEWVSCEELPLFVRKPGDGCGEEKRHHSGRILVPVDNSPAQWAFSLACSGKVPALEEIRQWLENDMIPMAMILKSEQRTRAKYRCRLSSNKEASVNLRGWKLAHITGVGLGKGRMEELEIFRLQKHHQDLLSPRNMFVVPLKLAGIAEVDVVTDVFGSARDKTVTGSIAGGNAPGDDEGG
jgi:hypothetical protein